MKKLKPRYRAWHKELKKMLHQEDNFIEFHLDEPQVILSPYSNKIVLMEYTGVNDVSGVEEICEGDILSDGSTVKFEVVKGLFNSAVIGEFLGFGLRDYPSFGRQKNNIFIFDKSYKKLKIVGNIYNNNK